MENSDIENIFAGIGETEESTETDNHYARFTKIQMIKQKDGSEVADSRTQIEINGKLVSTADGWRLMTSELKTTDGLKLGKMTLQLYFLAKKLKAEAAAAAKKAAAEAAKNKPT